MSAEPVNTDPTTKTSVDPESAPTTSQVAKKPKLQPGNVSLPFLANPHASLAFGRMDSNYTVVEFTLRINNQDSVARAVHQQLTSLITMDLAINEANFIRMWKTLILKRAQDVFESEKSQRANNFVRLIRNVLLPGPLGDLLHSMGYMHSKANGTLYHIVPPAQPAQPETWWQIDAAILATWNQEMHRMKNLYTMKEFPSLSQCHDRPLMLCLRNEANNMGSIRAWTNEPHLTDAVIRLVNDDLFDAHAHITFANCNLLMTYELNIPQARSEYVASYVITSNS